MSEHIITPRNASKQALYESLLPQLEGLTAGESDPVANMANVAAALRQAFGFFWTGFYRVIGDTLVLGPFQGPVACTRIAFGRGVCGTAWKERRTVIVPDVELFLGHIACSDASKSEIVVPLFDAGNVTGVLDIDSDRLNAFDETDAKYLACIAKLI